MASFKILDKRVLERLFDRDGYVLDFSNRTFSEFFLENGVNIDEEKYLKYGSSKMKRLRAFWDIESDVIVGKMIADLLEYGLSVNEIKKGEDYDRAQKIVENLTGVDNLKNESISEDDFLKQEFEQLNLSKLHLDSQLHPVIEQRINEIQISLKSKASLSVVFLCGSTLEGLLQDLASKNAQYFNKAKSSSKDKNQKVKQFHEWTLEALINTAHELNLLSLDVKKYSHSLKEFRNFIHPREQALNKFNPDVHTAKISWQVLKAAIANLCGER